MGRRILLADPRYIVRSGLRNFFLQEFPDTFIEEATSPEAFVSLLAAYPYDSIVVHQSFLVEFSPFPEGNIIVLAPKLDKAVLLEALESHAKAYLSDQPSENLLREALQLEPGEFLVDPTFLSCLLELIKDNSEQRIQLKQLTAREQEIVKLLNKGLSHKEIAKRLCITESTVKRHKANIGIKLKSIHEKSV